MVDDTNLRPIVLGSSVVYFCVVVGVCLLAVKMIFDEDVFRGSFGVVEGLI